MGLRTDTPRVRVRRRNDRGCVAEVGRAPANGAGGAAPKPPQRRLRTLNSVSDFLDGILQAHVGSAEAAHTACRIFDRLHAEMSDFNGSERSVRGYLQRRLQQLGLEHREVFVAQTCEWGSEAQVDWYAA